MGKRFRELTQTATDSDFVEGNYFGVDTPSVTKKVPANLFAKASDVSAFQAYALGAEKLGFRVFMNKANISFSNVAGSGTSATCTITLGALTSYWAGGYSSSSSQTFTDVPYYYGGLFIRINKTTKAFVEYKCYALSTISPGVPESSDVVSIPVAIWQSGKFVYRADEHVNQRDFVKNVVNHGFACATTAEPEIEFLNVSGNDPNQLCTVKLKNAFTVLALKNYVTVSANTSFENTNYSYGGLFLVVNIETNVSELRTARINTTGANSLNLADNEISMPVAIWRRNNVIFRAFVLGSDGVKRIAKNVESDNYVETQSFTASVGTAIQADFTLHPSYSKRKCLITIDATTASFTTFGISWDVKDTDHTFKYTGAIAAGSRFTMEVDVPDDKTTLIVWTIGNNVTSGGNVSISLTRYSVYGLLSEIYPEKINPSVVVPPQMYVVCNDISGWGKTRNYSVKSYIDHFIYKVSKKIHPHFLDGKITKDLYGKINEYGSYKNSSTSNTTKDVDTTLITDKIVLSDAEKYDISFNLISVRNKATENKICRLLCIGDSVTAGYLAGEGRPYTNCPQQYWAWVKALFESDYVQNGNSGFYFESLGNLRSAEWSGVTFDIDFGGISKNGVMACACGCGGSSTANWLAATLNNGVTNPLYDPVAQRFSLEYWVENYRTMAVGADGKAVRCTSETKGPLVDDVNAYNVCEPTHVLIQLGYNQSYSSVGTTRTNYLNDLRTMIDTIIEEYPTVKVLLSLPDTSVTYNLEEFKEYLSSSNDIYPMDATVGNAKLYHDSFGFMNADLMSLEQEYDGEVIYVPSYFGMPSLHAGVARNAPDFSWESSKAVDSEGKVFVSGNPLLHPNNAGHASIGYAVYSTLKNDLLTQT